MMADGDERSCSIRISDFGENNFDEMKRIFSDGLKIKQS
jgi:hypothetical protein